MVLSPVRSLVAAHKAPLALAAVSMISVAAMACSGSADPTAEASQVASQQQLNGDNKAVGLSSSIYGGIPASDSRLASSSVFAPVPSSDGSSQQMGIWVTGVGSKDIASDQAQVYLGVESRDETVTAAREKAATAMTAVLDKIKALGVSEDDIQTTSFNIYPQQTWIEVDGEFGKYSEPRIIGYVVSNQVSVTVTDIDLLDDVVDAAADQAGDLIRVNSISFTVADPAAYGAETRQLAAADAKAKAELYAQAMGVQLGPLLFLTELGSSSPLNTDSYARAEAGFSADAAYAPTPIQSGDVSLSTTIQAAFAIVP
jgi:hypothetical protein